MLRTGGHWPGSPLMLLLGWILLLACEAPAGAAAAIVGPWRVCHGPPEVPSSVCTTQPLYNVDPQGRMIWLTANVRLGEIPSEPAAVFVSAYAASAVYWDGKQIGSNGIPAERPGLEKPGLRDAAFPLHEATTGNHSLTIQMSSHHGLLRLRSPVTKVSIEPFERPSSKLMRDYLPALISAGALLIMVLVFAFLSWGGGFHVSSRYVLGAALFATGQLGAEASRAFLEFPYPSQFLRIGLVLAFAAGFGFTFLAYLARRFRLARLWPILAAQALCASAAILLVPSFDQKTGLVLTSATAIAMLLAMRATLRSALGGIPLVAMTAVGLILSLAEPYDFLDRNLHLWTAGLFLLLFTGEARGMKTGPIPEEPPMSYEAAASSAPAGVWLGTVATRRFLVPADIVRLAAADDYSEVFLTDGGSLLHPEPLEKLLKDLPQFLRIHRSHAINLSHLRSFRKGQRSSVLLSDQSVAPVSRRRVAMLQAELRG